MAHSGRLTFLPAVGLCAAAIGQHLVLGADGPGKNIAHEGIVFRAQHSESVFDMAVMVLWLSRRQKTRSAGFFAPRIQPIEHCRGGHGSRNEIALANVTSQVS